MKKFVLIAALAFGVMSAQAQERVVLGKCFDNVQIGLDGGATAPIKGDDFMKEIRGVAGLHIDKMLTPVFGMGIEGQANFNTSTWKAPLGIGKSNKLAIDKTYVGAYGKFNLFNMFGGYKARFFDIEAQAGAGWGRDWFHVYHRNYFSTKAGLNFNFNVCKNWTIALKPSVTFHMTGAPYDKDYSQANYDARKAQVNLFASVAYNINPGFELIKPYDQEEVDNLNAQINELRGKLSACEASQGTLNARIKQLEADLAACNARKAQVKEVVSVNNTLSSVRYVFFKIGSSAITGDQMPNVEMIAAYMKNHPKSKVVIKGYASQDGNLEKNKQLAQKRAEAVKTALINRYKVAANRIVAEGEGIGHMFEEESWNRVSICTLE